MKKLSPAAVIAVAIMLVASCGGRIYSITPFGTAMFCALCDWFFIGLTAPIYLLCEFLFSFELWRLYASGLVIFIAAFRWLLAMRFPKLNGLAVKAVFAVCAIVAHSVLSGVFIPIVDAAVSGFIGCFYYYFTHYAAGCARELFSSRLNIVESASVSVVFFVMGLAFGRARYGDFVIGLAPATLVLLLVGLVGVKAEFVCAIAVALGLGYTDMTLIPAVLALSLGIAAFGSLYRIVYALTGIGLFAAVAVLFYADPIYVGYCCAMSAAGAALFCLLPKRAVKKVRDYFDYDCSAQLALRHYINRCKADAGNRMLAVASVFDETARLMSVLGSPPPDYAAMGEALRQRVCPYCTARNECNAAKATEAFTLLAERASANKAILSDLPEFFTAECRRATDVISESAVITDSARKALRERESEQRAKAIVTERLTAIKDVLEELGRSEALPVGFDAVAEKRIVAELKLNGVECAEAFCTRDGVTAVVRTRSADRSKIKKAVSVCLKREHEVIALEKTQAAGWSVATLKRRPMYDAVYARAGLAKQTVTGDSYTFERIGNRFLAGLFDGMGSGTGASASSSAAVELISCFYRAGFDSQSVIAGVNRFLKLPATENYSAADIAVCDLDTAAVDIIKIGAPPCYIKTTDTVLRIQGNSLPIGVLDEMRPFVTTKRLYPGQMLVLVSDGVSDCFAGDELPEFINGLSAFNPEATVSAIVARAKALSGDALGDDMTAIAFRLIEKKKR